MTDNPWYSFYVGDYARKTAHLSLLEHGAYRRLLDHYYALRSPLPSDPIKLYRICGARTPAERKAVLFAATEFFTENESLLRNERCDSEIAKLLRYSERQSATAKLRHSHGTATAQPARASTTTTTIISKKVSKITGSRFTLTELPNEWKEFCLHERPDLNPQRIFEEFRDYWISVPGARATKLDWFATWRNRVREKKANNTYDIKLKPIESKKMGVITI